MEVNEKTKIYEVGNLPQEDEIQVKEDLFCSNLDMIFSKLPQLLAQAKYQLESTSTLSNPDNMTSAVVTSSNEHYISCIKINGVPILPPVLDDGSRKEMQQYREEAVRRSKAREKQKMELNSNSKSLVPTVSLPENTTNDSQSDCDSLESSKETAILVEDHTSTMTTINHFAESGNQQMLTSNIDPPNHSMKGDDEPATASKMLVDNLFDFNQMDVLNSFSGFGSLDDGSLPTQLHGIPLTSKSEQQITRDLSTLSKHLPDSCASASSEFCDLSLDLTSRLTALTPTLNCLTPERTPFCPLPPPSLPLCLASTSSPINDETADQNPAQLSENKSTPVENDFSHLLKAPIFITDDNGLHLSKKKTPPSSCSPSLKENPVISKQPWIMNSPLIAYVTKKRPKPVGMCSISIKPDALTKSQRVNNATYTIPSEGQVELDDYYKYDNEKSELKRPIIKAEQRSSTPILQLDYHNDSLPPAPSSTGKTKKLHSVPSKNHCTNSPCDLSKSPSQGFTTPHRIKPLTKADRQKYKSPSATAIQSNHFVCNINNSSNSNNNNNKGSNPTKVNLDVINVASSSTSSLTTSTPDLSHKEHLGDDSLDELILGVENIGLVPRIDGDGSDVPSPSSLSKDNTSLPIFSDITDQNEIKQAWQKHNTSHSPELIRANFSPVGTDCPHHLQVSVATVDVTKSSGIASLCDISDDSPVTYLTQHQPKLSTSILSEADSSNFSSSRIRRGSYTLLEPSINLVKLAQLSPSPRSSNNISNISDRIPSYSDFEIDLNKRIPSKTNSPVSIRPITATPSQLASPLDSIKVKKTYSDSKCILLKKPPRKSMSPSVSKSKSLTPSNKKTSNSFHLTPQIPKIRKKSLLRENSKQKDKSTLIPQPSVTKKTSPRNFREWRLSNIDAKVSLDTPIKDIDNVPLDEGSLNVSTESLCRSLPSPSLTDSPLDWDNKIEDQLKCFFSEKKNSCSKLKKEFNDWQLKMGVAEEKFQKTLESISLPKQCSDHNWGPGHEFFTPDVSFASIEHGQIETPIKQLFAPQIQDVSPLSSQVSNKITTNIINLKSSNPRLEIIPAACKGFLTRKLLSCPKVVSLRKTIQECRKLLEETDSSTNVDFINRINNQLESAQQEIHAIFFEGTIQERMALIRLSRALPKKTELKNKVPQLSCATQKYQMRKKAEKVSIPAKCPPLKSQKSVPTQKDTKVQMKKENRSVRKIAPPNQAKKHNVISVAGKMTATRVVATKANIVPLKNNSYTPWR